MKTSRKVKKLDDKWTGPYEIIKVYLYSGFIQLLENVRIFPVFHHFLFISVYDAKRFLAQIKINNSESWTKLSRVLEREDSEDESVQKWVFEGILDNHNEDGYHYLVKWRHYAPTWQPALDLKSDEKVVAQYHHLHPEKPGPPKWVLDDPTAKEILLPGTDTVRPPARRSTRQKKVKFS
ncbi:hypothetical protein BCIN_12g04370 [Botrytis cinerea B05.10]|uniref:Chromo domain-containing protein n=1 Tax=Botryotinia fuckeliana (strain B05.10) TaxID=332648 RepID=A0A384K035_BOTFB|nr:hypothetical protein BCIN_12g04370 [Botrytis cinerea B05.10]ATZ55887.1 hypothetical protein BCIN_12g04370 [Botrytis cinerea B05.10]